MPYDPSIPPAMNDREQAALISKAAQEVYVAGYRSLKVRAKLFFPHIFRVDFTPTHHKLFDFLQDVIDDQRKLQAAGRPCGKKVCIIGGRGIAKTKTITHALMAGDILYGLSPFNVFVTKSEPNSIMQTESLRGDLVRSERIRSQFGNVKELAREGGFEEAFGKSAWVAGTIDVKGLPNYHKRSLILPRGAGQQIRGLNYNGHRPWRIYVDDFDHDDWFYNDELLKYYHRDWFHGAVEYCVSQLGCENIPWTILVTDTCKDSRALVEELAKDAEWETLRIPICDENFKTLDPSFRTQEVLDKEISAARERGTIDVLARELMCIPAASENRPFTADLFQYYNEKGMDLESVRKRAGGAAIRQFDPAKPGLINVVLVDPARTMSPASDPTAIVGVSVDLEQPGIFVREIINDRMMPADIYEAALDMVERLNARVLGVEYAGLHLHLSQPLHEQIAARGLFHLNLLELKPQMGKGEQSGYTNGKIARIIWGLSQWYKAHIVYHNPHGCEVLESQLLGIPAATLHDDVADCFAYLQQVFEQCNMRFDWGAKPKNTASPAELARFSSPLETVADEQRFDWDDLPSEMYELTTF